MLDKLVISKSNAAGDTKRKSILLTTFMVVLSLFSTGMIYSLFTQNLAMGQDNLNISTLIAPPAIPQEKPPAPEPDKPQKQPNKKATSQVITRKYNIQRVSDSPRKTPKTISTDKPKFAARPDAPFILTGKDTGSVNQSTNDGQSTNRGTTDNIGIATGDPSTGNTKPVKTSAKKTVRKPPPIVKPKKKNIVVSKGVLNGRAKHLVVPVYSSLAKNMRAKGKVTIQIMIDENGSVISANSLGGHKLLVPAALRAARASKFTPTFLGDQRVKVRGVIVYNFAL